MVQHLMLGQRDALVIFKTGSGSLEAPSDRNGQGRNFRTSQYLPQRADRINGG
jgi:hypothetical protein